MPAVIRFDPRLLACVLPLFLASEVLATPPDVTGVVTGNAPTVIKLAVPDAMGPAKVGAAATELIQVLRDDLAFTGYFEIVDPSRYKLIPPPDRQVRHQDWLSIGADALVRLELAITGEKVDLQAWLHDNTSGSQLFGRRYGGRTDLVRRVAHQVADDLVHHYTGRPGVALTRIAFVSKHGEGKEIYLMDYDGRMVRRLTTNGILNLSPTWSPDREELAFTSWRGRQPGVYVMSSEGELKALKTVGGELASSPDWSPDGRQLAYSSDLEGNTEIYVLNRSTGRNRRLTFNGAIDTSPAFSPNGREIAFTSDRTGTPQIYLMDGDGLNVRRISWSGSYNESAAWSPRGDQLAFASRIDGRFHIFVLDLASGDLARLTSGQANHENPHWSPDGRHMVFASDRTGSYQIYTMRADGTHVTQLTRGRDSYTPDWSR